MEYCTPDHVTNDDFGICSIGGQAAGSDHLRPMRKDPTYSLIVKRLKGSAKIGEREAGCPAHPPLHQGRKSDS